MFVISVAKTAGKVARLATRTETRFTVQSAR
jgi:hypothetical protein